MKRLLTLLLLLVAASCSAQVGGGVVPGSLGVVGNPTSVFVDYALLLRPNMLLYPENFTAGTTGATSTWSDISGNNNHCTVLTDTAKPTKVSNYVYFDGTDYLQTKSTVSITATCTFVVLMNQLEGTGAYKGVFYRPDGNYGTLFGTNNVLYTNQGVGMGPFNAPIPAGTIFFARFLYGIDGVVSYNETIIATGTTGTSNLTDGVPTILMASNLYAINCKANVYAIAHYNRRLSQFEGAQIMESWKRKFGVSTGPIIVYP